MEHIETITLSASQSSITFSSIPQDYDDLIVFISVRSDRAAATEGFDILLNGSSANMTRVILFGSPVDSFTGTNTIGVMPSSSATANTFGSYSTYISNYSGSTAKSISTDGVAENNSTTNFDTGQSICATLFNDTTAITSISFEPDGANNLVSGCTASLYGVTAGGSGTVTTA